VGWLTGWQYRRPVTINNTNNSNDLTDYQVLVVVDTASLIQQGKMQADGDDIRFTDSDGTTLLPYWIEGPINDANTKIWVKVPSIPAQGTKVIYFYYGNPTASSESSVTNTFIREIDGAQPVKGSWHIDKGSGTTTYDSSGNNNHGTIYGAVWTTGRFGYALQFDGVDDYVDVGTGLNDLDNVLSIEAWIYPTNLSGRRPIYSTRINNANGSYQLEVGAGNGGTNRIAVTTPGMWNLETYDNAVTTNVWQHIVYVKDGTFQAIYKDGASLPLLTNAPETFIDNNDPKLIGKGIPSYTVPFAGRIDEVRIYNRPLTAEEISDLYNYYGYTTPNYAGRVLVRKRIDPEPTTSVGNEETSEVPPIVIVQRRLLIIGV